VSGPALTSLALAETPERWAALGFTVSEGVCMLGRIRLDLGQPGEGIAGWSLTASVPLPAEIDGLPTRVHDGLPLRPAAGAHPNLALGLDHVVVVSPDFDRTAAALAGAGMALRRIRDAGGFRQGFRRIGPAVLELVEARDAPAGPARFWGLVATVPDLRELGELLADHLGEPRPAVQPGREIATVRRSAELSFALAFMTPEPRPG
jgi:hypothetical protein